MRCSFRFGPCLLGLGVAWVLCIQADAGQHRVNSGESLWTIAAKHHTTVHSLCRLNGLSEQATLRPGQRLRVPGPPAPKKPAGPPKGYLADSLVAIHAGPGTDYDRTAVGCKGTRVVLLGKCAGWFLVRFPNGTEGWAPWRSVKTAQGDQVERLAAPPKPTTPSKASTFPLTGTLRANTILRSGPGAGYPDAGAAVAGALCTVVGATPGWLKVQVGPTGTGWVPAALLNTQTLQVVDSASTAAPPGTVTPPPGDPPSAPPPPPTPPLEPLAIVTDGVNLRAGPETEAECLARLHRGTRVELLDAQGNWRHVRLTDGREGWVASWLTAAPASVAPPPGHENGFPALVAAAMRYRGVPYRRGGMTSRGFDCSGLVSRVLRSQGIAAPRTSRQLFHLGKPVKKNDLRPGDLVFFRNTYRRGISHVGIYVGNGKFIHASNSRRGVTVSSLASPYYARRWAGARRLR